MSETTVKTELPSRERLARDLEALNLPRLAVLIDAVRAGYYDELESPLQSPTISLECALAAHGLHEMALAVRLGRYDPSMAEAMAWAESHGLVPAEQAR